MGVVIISIFTPKRVKENDYIPFNFNQCECVSHIIYEWSGLSLPWPWTPPMFSHVGSAMHGIHARWMAINNIMIDEAW